MNNDKNPYANPDGSPIDGKEPEFFEWEKNKDKERLNKLSPEEKKAEISAQQDLNKRMQS